MCFRVAIPFALPLVISETFCVLCHCHNLVLIAFGFSHSDRCEMVSQCGFNLNIFITVIGKHLLICLFVTCIFSDDFCFDICSILIHLFGFLMLFLDTRSFFKFISDMFPWLRQ